MKFTTTAAAAGIALMMAGGASAATMNGNPGQGGGQGQGQGGGQGQGQGGGQGSDLCNTSPLQDCFVSDEGLPETEAIAKYNFGTEVFEGNSNFSTVDGTEFGFDGLSFDDVNDVSGGIVTYTLGVGDPGMTAFSTKRGQTETLFFGDDIQFDGTVFTFDLGSGENAVSNFVIYDNFDTTVPVPLPAAGWLMLAGLGGLAALRRRKAV